MAILSECYTHVDKFDPDNYKEYFKYDHYCEHFDKNKLYEKGILKHDFGYGEHEYSWNKYIINNFEYAVVEEHPSEKELDKLKPYCQCAICTAKWYNPLIKRLACRCCCGCLYSNRNNAYILGKTREYINNTKNKEMRHGIFSSFLVLFK